MSVRLPRPPPHLRKGSAHPGEQSPPVIVGKCYLVIGTQTGDSENEAVASGFRMAVFTEWFYNKGHYFFTDRYDSNENIRCGFLL